MADDGKRILGYVLVALIFAGTIAAAVAGEIRRGARAEKEGGRKAERLLGGKGLSSFVAFGGVLDAPRAPGTAWDAPGNFVFNKFAMVSLGDAAQSVTEVELSLDHNDSYKLRWMYRARLVGEPAEVGPSSVTGGGLAIYRVRTRAEAVDTVIIMAASGDGKYSVGHVVPVRP